MSPIRRRNFNVTMDNNAAAIFILTFLFCECFARSIYASDKELECFGQNKLYHPNEDKCYKLLTQGPCEPGYWFVLQKPKQKLKNDGEDDLQIKGICVKEKCPEGGYYWNETKICVQPKDKKQLCGNSSDEELLNNYFGEAECMCARDPPRARYEGDDNSRCYQLYTQGPCRQGQVLAYVPGNLDKATCIEDKCYEETAKRQRDGTLSRYGVLAPWTNGSCYELGTQGPCPETLKFKVHETILQPDCITLLNAIFDLEKPQTCYQDENGDCQKKISRHQNAMKYKEELLAALNSAKRKRSLRRLVYRQPLQ